MNNSLCFLDIDLQTCAVYRSDYIYRCRDSGKWARRAQSSALLQLQDVLGGGFGEGLEVLDIDEVAIQSVLYLHPVRGVEVFVREEGDGGKENVDDGRGENAPLLDRHIHTEEWGLPVTEGAGRYY